MVPPRRKRQKVQSTSDDQNDYGKTRQPSEPNIHKHSQSKPISAFFGPALPLHNAKSTEAPSPRADLPIAVEEPEDAIEDLSEGESTPNLPPSSKEQGRIRRSGDNNSQNGQKSTRGVKEGVLPPGGQRFKIYPNGKPASPKTQEFDNVDLKPWVERFKPINLEELAVHKKKISDVQGWLERAIHGIGYERLLVLKGPAGAGKTTTLNLLAQFMAIQVLEWQNPVGSSISSEGYMSLSAQFEDFLGRSHRYARLQTDGNIEHLAQSSGLEDNLPSLTSQQKITLVEEFPSSLLFASSALQSFRQSIMRYLAACTPSFSNPKADVKPTPMVMIVTESRLASNEANNESFTMHRLLGPEIIDHPAVHVIEFNPVATTFLQKALSLVVQKEARQSGRRRVPGPSVLKQLSEIGDLTSAIGSLQFLCIKSDDEDAWSGTVAAYTKKGKGGSTEMTKMERELLDMVISRQISIGMFHAVGKIVYNKRIDSTPDEDSSTLVKVPEVSIDQLMGECGTDVDTFIAALQENYTLSCEGHSFTESADGCLDNLSDSDILGTAGGGGWRRGTARPTTTLLDGLRHQEITFNLATRGILYSLPYPVHRSSAPPRNTTSSRTATTSRPVGHQMYGPTSLKLARQIEEREDLLKRWQRKTQDDIEIQATVMASDRSSLISKNVLVLERLPYLHQIAKGQALVSPLMCHLDSLVQFAGTETANADEDDVEGEGEGVGVNASGGADMPGDRHRWMAITSETTDNDANDLDASNLYLEEDDIEDY